MPRVLTNAEKKRLYRIVRAAIECGELVPEPCEVCGCVGARAYHPDPSKPLEVRWLCRRHQGQVVSSSPRVVACLYGPAPDRRASLMKEVEAILAGKYLAKL